MDDINNSEAKKVQRLGFMRGRFKVPDDIKGPFKEEVDAGQVAAPFPIARNTGEKCSETLRHVEKWRQLEIFFVAQRWHIDRVLHYAQL